MKKNEARKKVAAEMFGVPGKCSYVVATVSLRCYSNPNKNGIKEQHEASTKLSIELFAHGLAH